MIGAGAMRHYLALQTNAPTLNSVRSPVPNWTTSSYHWAEVRTPNAREYLLAQQQQTILSHIITIRHPGFEPDGTSRFVDVESGKVYNVAPATDPDGRRQVLVFFASRDPSETASA